VDRSLVRLMARRVRLAWRAAALERAGDVAMPDPAREVGAVRRAAVVAREAGLDEEVVRCVFWHLVRLSRHARPRTGGDAEGGR
jgi:chorismate mutase